MENEVLKTVLKNMFEYHCFDICTIDKLLKMTGCIPDKNTYSKMSALHCIKYSDMSDELRKWLYRETIKMFTPNGFDLRVIDAVFETDSNLKIIDITDQPKKSFLQRLLN